MPRVAVVLTVAVTVTMGAVMGAMLVVVLLNGRKGVLSDAAVKAQDQLW
jgi:hypothetical protein